MSKFTGTKGTVEILPHSETLVRLNHDDADIVSAICNEAHNGKILPLDACLLIAFYGRLAGYEYDTEAVDKVNKEYTLSITTTPLIAVILLVLLIIIYKLLRRFVIDIRIAWIIGQSRKEIDND